RRASIRASCSPAVARFSTACRKSPSKSSISRSGGAVRPASAGWPITSTARRSQPASASCCTAAATRSASARPRAAARSCAPRAAFAACFANSSDLDGRDPIWASQLRRWRRRMDDYTDDAAREARRLRLRLDEEGNATARIKVIGVGGGGSNAVNRMVQAGFEGVEFIVANTDLQALRVNAAPLKLQIGSKLTKGLGAGADPNVGRSAALEDTDKIIQALDGADMIF